MLFALLLTGCHEAVAPFQRNLTLDAFDEMKVQGYALNSQDIRDNLEHFSVSDRDANPVVGRVRKYYQEGRPLVWIDVAGVDNRADTLLATLRAKLPEMGFKDRNFRLDQIEKDLDCMRTLSFDQSDDINKVAARLEYNLTRAYLRYVTGQRFGFVNPNYVLNTYDARDRDSTGHVKAYRHLYDVGMEHPNDAYTVRALRHVNADSLGDYLRQVEPKGKFYHLLMEKLHAATDSQRPRILVNMERCRWRDTLKVESSKRYVVVNVPAFHLWAVCPDSIVDMRVACGAVKTKTPLLTSRITHMEVNPEWSIPMSIIRDDVAHHGGDSAYFARHRYYIADRKTGQRLSPQHVSASMLRSGNYKVAQVGGAGNSLGRIIFRFPNNFSVFLHDTSSPGAFGRDNRGVSHGCVRVQHPFELAKFLLGDDADEQLLDKLRISMGMKPETDWGRDLVDALDPAAPTPKLVSWLKVSPRVPLIISYYTIFLTPNGTLQYYPDVYGYDKVIRESLATYTQ